MNKTNDLRKILITARPNKIDAEIDRAVLKYGKPDRVGDKSPPDPWVSVILFYGEKSNNGLSS